MSETKKTVGKAKSAPATQEAEIVVYIGPDIPGAKQYTVYNNGLPPILEKAIALHPFFASLVISVSRLPEANIQLMKEGSALNTLYKRAEEYQFILETE